MTITPENLHTECKAEMKNKIVQQGPGPGYYVCMFVCMPMSVHVHTCEYVLVGALVCVCMCEFVHGVFVRVFLYVS